MTYLQQTFSVKFEYKVYFCKGLFDLENPLLNDFLKERSGTDSKILFVIDEGIIQGGNDIVASIHSWFRHYSPVNLVPEIIILPGGEEVKNRPEHCARILDAINNHKIDRHSYLAAIGGGSVLDLAGYAAAIAHRGIRHIRIPSTVLSQNDSGVGVKNGVNYFGKKNFLGTFVPPVAVFNDEALLSTLSDRHWRSGISEAVKVALIKDCEFFEWLEQNAVFLNNRSMTAMGYLIKRCAELHLQHIAGADPFETGSSRPLDFGHWSAHKLEQLSHYELIHGEAVALGIALDTIYSKLSGRLGMTDADRVINLLKKLGFDVFHSLMEPDTSDIGLLSGLEEFREHLGGRLTIMLLDSIGRGVEVHELETSLVRNAAIELKAFHSNNSRR